MRLNDSAPNSGDASVTVDQDGTARLFAFVGGNSTVSGNLRIRGTDEAYSLPLSITVTGTANSGGLVRLTTSGAHGLITGATVIVSGIVGTTEANGTWVVTKIDATHIDLVGTTYANAYTSGGTVNSVSNGFIALTGTLSQTYADNDIAIVVKDISSGTPKGTKIAFWKERMIIIGVSSDTSVDNSSAVAYMSQFASARDLQKIIVFGTTGGATEEWVGKAGKLTNIVTTRDYMYLFKEDEVYFCNVTSVDASTGATYPQLLSNNYGCVNEDCAVDMGDGYIAFLTKNKRVMGIKISSQTGQALVFPDESFDQAVRNTCDLMDSDQSKARLVYHVGKRLLYAQVSVQSNIITMVNDNNIKHWIPPDDQKQFNDFFEKDGILYATDLYDQTIYEMDRGTLDNGLSIETVMAHGRLTYMVGRGMRIGGTSEWKDVEMRGAIAQNGVITVETKVDDGTSKMKTINASSYSFADKQGLGDVAIGDLVIGNATTSIDMADWQVNMRIAPVSYGAVYQTILSSTSPFIWRHYKVNASNLSSPTVPLT